MTHPDSRERYHGSDFVTLALAEFPELREDFDEYPDLLHLQTAAFARLTQAAQERADWETFARCAQLADRLLVGADEELSNALAVSYLENLDFDGPNGDLAWTYFTPALRAGWRMINGYLGRRVPQSDK